jgi:D-amino-acid dehydrogenase
MRVVVVGGGVVGLACAWELARGDAEVVVLDRGALGAGASRGNAGWICPTLSSPLPGPGMVREGLHQLLHRGEAFVLRPRLDLTFLRWLWTFWRHCAPERYEAGVRALLELNRRTMELYDRYRDEGVDFEMHETGLVIAALSEDGLASYRRLAHLLGRFGSPGRVDELDGSAAAELEPSLDGDRIACALHARLDRHVRPERLTAGLAASLRDKGVAIHEGWQVDSLRPRGDGWLICSPNGDTTAEKVVVAAGLGAVGLLREHGVRMPLVGAGGYSTTVTGTGTPPAHALYLAEAKLGVSPFAAGVRVAGVLELGAREARPSTDTAAKLLAAAEPYLRGWRPDMGEAAAGWAGLRPATADGLPLIGAVAGRANLFAAAGHAMLGVTLAPATAAALAPLVLAGDHGADLAPFAVSRPARQRRRRPRGSPA